MKTIPIVFLLLAQTANASKTQRVNPSGCQKTYFTHPRSAIGRMAIEDIQHAERVNQFVRLNAPVNGEETDETYMDLFEDKHSLGPAEIVEAENFQERFLEAMATVGLTPNQLSIVMERISDPTKEFTEMARVRGVSSNAVRYSLHAAQKKIEKILEMFDMEIK